MTEEWLCRGPGGTQGEGVVGNGWHKCFDNYTYKPNQSFNQCNQTFQTLSDAKQTCIQLLKDEIDIHQTNFNPDNYSCAIQKDTTKCNGEYIVDFKKELPKPITYYDHNGRDKEMELHLMDVDEIYHDYIEELKNDTLKQQAAELRQIKQQQLRQQRLTMIQKQKEDKERKQRQLKEQLENQLIEEIREQIKNDIGDVKQFKHGIVKSLQQTLTTDHIKDFQNIQQQKHLQNIQQQKHLQNIQQQKRFQEMKKKLQLRKQDLQKLSMNINQHSHRGTENIINTLSELKQTQDNQMKMMDQLLEFKKDTSEKPFQINKFLDDTEDFLLKILSTPSKIESFSKKRCIYKDIMGILIFVMILTLFFYHL